MKKAGSLLSVFATAKEAAKEALHGSGLDDKEKEGHLQSPKSRSGLLPSTSSSSAKALLKSRSSRGFNKCSVLSADEKFNRLSTHVFHGISCNTPVEDIYELGEEIGKGAFGIVYKARDRKTGHEFCCKTIKKELLTREVFDDIKLEAEVMMHLRGHPNVVEIMGLFEDENHIHIVQELCTGGDLLSKVSKSLEPCTEQFAASIMREVLLVIQHCHSYGVLYRDIKPDNFLLSSDDPTAQIKATDFGISKFMKPGETTDEFMGTPTYMAPEVFNMECGFPSDIWSAGVMLYWLLSGEFPFKGSNKLQLGMQVVQQDPCMEGEAWNEISPEAKEVINMMLNKEPSERATVKELLSHKWFKQASGVKTRPPGNMLLSRFRLFVQMHEFKKEVLRCTIRNLDTEYLVGVRAMFNAMNTSGSGYITLEELLAALDKQGCKANPKELESLFKGMDVEGNNLLSFEEFSPATLNHSLLEKKGLLRSLFRMFDRKGRGYISQHDLEAALKGNQFVNEKSISKIMSQVDLNQDGKIDFNEFVVMMFGEDAGLQRLGRGKSNAWSYQNSKESTGAMRDATGNLLKAPNLSNYRKVNNPYSAAFLATSKHTPKRPNTPTIILPSAPHFQKLSKDRGFHHASISPKLYSSGSGLDRQKRSSSSGMLAHRQSGDCSPTLSRANSGQRADRYLRDGERDSGNRSSSQVGPPPSPSALLKRHSASGNASASALPKPLQRNASNSSLTGSASRCFSLPEEDLPPMGPRQSCPSWHGSEESRGLEAPEGMSPGGSAHAGSLHGSKAWGKALERGHAGRQSSSLGNIKGSLSAGSEHGEDAPGGDVWLPIYDSPAQQQRVGGTQTPRTPTASQVGEEGVVLVSRPDSPAPLPLKEGVHISRTASPAPLPPAVKEGLKDGLQAIRSDAPAPTPLPVKEGLQASSSSASPALKEALQASNSASPWPLEQEAAHGAQQLRQMMAELEGGSSPSEAAQSGLQTRSEGLQVEGSSAEVSMRGSVNCLQLLRAAEGASKSVGELKGEEGHLLEQATGMLAAQQQQQQQQQQQAGSSAACSSMAGTSHAGLQHTPHHHHHHHHHHHQHRHLLAGGDSTPPARPSLSLSPASNAASVAGGSSSEIGMHRLSVGSHAHSSVQVLTPSRTSLQQAGSARRSQFARGSTTGGLVPLDSSPGPSSSPRANSMSSQGAADAGSSLRSGRAQLQPYGSGGASTSALAHTDIACSSSSNSYSCSHGSGHVLRDEQRSQGEVGAGIVLGPSSSTATKKYGWGKGSRKHATSEGQKGPAPNISSRQGGPKSFAGMRKSHSRGSAGGRAPATSGRASATSSPALSQAQQPKVDHHKGVVDCVIS